MDERKLKQLPSVEVGEEAPAAPTAAKHPKSYILYCCMTLSVMLLTVAFAATELFAVFFSDLYPDRLILSKLFGAAADSEMSFQEILLNQSFVDLSFSPIEKEPQGTPPNEIPNDTDPIVPQDTPPDAPPQNEPEGDAPSGEAPGTPQIPSGMKPIISMDLSLSEFGLGYLHNTSSKSPDTSSLSGFELSTDVSAVYPKNSPLVLIIHTHGTESYSEGDFYDPASEVARSTDKNKNVISIGRAIANILNEGGVATLHCDVMHDEESYGGSYGRSAQTVKEYLAKYPTIRYVIDIHRDAIVKSSGELVGATAQTENGACAQVMAVVGTGEDGTPCPNYLGNLALAQKFREILNEKAANLCRPTCLRPSAYNQQYSAYSMLIEVGAAGNTLDEAMLAAKFIGSALAAIIKGES